MKEVMEIQIGVPLHYITLLKFMIDIFLQTNFRRK